MKKLLSAAAGMLLVSVGLLGCGTTADPGGESPRGEDSSAAEDSAFPVTIETAFGSVTVDERPTKVVALGWGDAETALALGVQPIGASDWLAFGGDGVGPWAEGLYDESPEIIATLEPSYEAIAALEPDLILDVKSSGDQERYEKLSQIATTVGVPEGKQSFLAGVEEQVTMISTALGVQDEGEDILSEYERRFADEAEAHPEFDGATVSVAAFTSKGWGAYIAESERVKFMERLGLQQNPAVEALTPDGFSVDVSDEQLSVLDADLVVVFPIGLPASDVTSQELFQQVPAVQDSRAIVFDADDEDIRLAYSANTILSIPFALDELVPRMSEALD